MQAHASHVVAQSVAVPGTFAGHVLPGTLFLAWAAVWIAELWRDRGARPAGSPVERSGMVVVLKIVLPLLGVVVERPDPTWAPHFIVMNYQHAVMYAFFALSGVVDLAHRRGLVPRGATYLAFAGAAANAGVLFLVHDPEAGISRTVHVILGTIFVANALAAVGEWLRPRRELHWLRLGTMLTLGGWFYVVAWLLYRSPYDLADPVVSMRAQLFFSLQVIAVSALLLALRVARPAVAPAAAPAAAPDRSSFSPRVAG